MQVDTIHKIRENYKRIERSIVEQLFLEFSNHCPTTGSYREDVWYSLFRQIIPYKFAIEKGVFIIDSGGKISREVDLAIFDEQYTPYIFNYGNVRFIPIEAVAVVVQCKSNHIDQENLKQWSESIMELKTDTNSITRMYSGVVEGWLNDSDQETNANGEGRKYTQTATRPIRILCYLKKEGHSYTKLNKEFFDITICANGQEVSDPKLEIGYNNDWNLGEWYEYLNHNDIDLHRYKQNYSNNSTLAERYTVNDNPILSLIFQLNQLLMLINNPMLFPHQAYVKMFNNEG